MDVLWPFLFGGIAGVVAAVSLIFTVNGLMAQRCATGQKSAARITVIAASPSFAEPLPQVCNLNARPV